MAHNLLPLYGSSMLGGIYNSERSEVPTRGSIERIWLRLFSKLSLSSTESVLAFSIAPHTSS